MSEVEGLLLVLAGVVAGAASAMAGGASLLTFPVLLSFGLPPLTANVTNTVGLVPTSIGAALASRDEMRGQWRLLFLLMIPAALGSVLGSALLLLAPAQVFSAVVPGLLALSSVLLLAQPWLLARLRTKPGEGGGRGLWLSTLVSCVYAGYFGAAAAILFLSLAGLFSSTPIHRLNAMKNLLMGTANAVALAVFAVAAPVQWPFAAALAVGTLLGGAVGVRLARRVPPKPLRFGTAAVGLAVAGWLVVSGG